MSSTTSPTSESWIGNFSYSMTDSFLKTLVACRTIPVNYTGVVVEQMCVIRPIFNHNSSNPRVFKKREKKCASMEFAMEGESGESEGMWGAGGSGNISRLIVMRTRAIQETQDGYPLMCWHVYSWNKKLRREGWDLD